MCKVGKPQKLTAAGALFWIYVQASLHTHCVASVLPTFDVRDSSGPQWHALFSMGKICLKRGGEKRDLEKLQEGQVEASISHFKRLHFPCSRLPHALPFRMV